MAPGSVGKRKAERRDCHVRAQARFGTERAPVDCLIVNFSASGARIRFSDVVELPPRFNLFIPSRPETKSVVVRWRSGKEYGVSYSTGASHEADIAELFERIETIEKQMAAAAHADAHAHPHTGHPHPAHHAPPGATLGLPDESAAEIRARIDAVEIIAADAAADLEKAIGARLEALEKRFSEPVREPVATPDPAALELAARMAGFEERLQRIARDEPAVVERQREPSPSPDWSARLTALEARIEKVAALEARVENIAALEARMEDVAAQGRAPDYGDAVAALSQRLATIENERCEARAPATPQPEPSRALLGRLDALTTEIDMLRARPVAPDFSADISALAQRLAAHEETLRETAQTRAAPNAPPRDEDALTAAFARISDLEVEMLNVKFGKPAVDPQVEARLARLETTGAEIQTALREVLGLLTRHMAEERAAG